jgi:hypothetical protein
MHSMLAEAVGTMILILLGDGVVANVVLNRTKGQNSGWIVITTGWGIAVATAVYAVGRISGAHLSVGTELIHGVEAVWQTHFDPLTLMHLNRPRAGQSWIDQQRQFPVALRDRDRRIAFTEHRHWRRDRRA